MKGCDKVWQCIGLSNYVTIVTWLMVTARCITVKKVKTLHFRINEIQPWGWTKLPAIDSGCVCITLLHFSLRICCPLNKILCQTFMFKMMLSSIMNLSCFSSWGVQQWFMDTLYSAPARKWPWLSKCTLFHTIPNAEFGCVWNLRNLNPTLHLNVSLKMKTRFKTFASWLKISDPGLPKRSWKS